MGQDRQIQMVGGNGGNQFRQYAGQNARNPAGYNDVIGNQNQIGNGNLVAACAKGNAAGQNGNQIRCYNCRGVEEYDLMAAVANLDEIKKVNASCILMANLQQASTSGTQTDSAPVHDTDGSAEEEINKEHEEAYKNIDWNAALDHVQSKEPQYIKRYHGMKKKPQTESEARKNMIFYLKNTEGYKMDFFKGMTYDEILPIFKAKFEANMRFLFKSREEMEAEDREIIKTINETPAQKAAKRRKLSEEAQEAEDLRKRLEIV
nr:hypothetical protein [Tanacetum cinerariifolium]